MKKLVIKSWHVRKRTQKGVVHLIDDRIPKELLDKTLRKIKGKVIRYRKQHIIKISESALPACTGLGSLTGKSDVDTDSARKGHDATSTDKKKKV